MLGNHLLGGSSMARVPARVREKEGLSYSTYTSFSSSAFDESASFGVSAIFAPQNRARVERAIREELVRALKDGFTAAEVEDARKALLEARRVARTQDRALAGRLGSYLFAEAHLRLGHRVRVEDRRADPGRGARRAAAAHRPGQAVGRDCRRLQEVKRWPSASSALSLNAGAIRLTPNGTPSWRMPAGRLTAARSSRLAKVV